MDNLLTRLDNLAQSDNLYSEERDNITDAIDEINKLRAELEEAQSELRVLREVMSPEQQYIDALITQQETAIIELRTEFEAVKGSASMDKIVIDELKNANLRIMDAYDELETSVTNLCQALEAVEWAERVSATEFRCPRCKGDYPNHEDGCEVDKALKGEPQGEPGEAGGDE